MLHKKFQTQYFVLLKRMFGASMVRGRSALQLFSVLQSREAQIDPWSYTFRHILFLTRYFCKLRFNNINNITTKLSKIKNIVPFNLYITLLHFSKKFFRIPLRKLLDIFANFKILFRKIFFDFQMPLAKKAQPHMSHFHIKITWFSFFPPLCLILLFPCD